jgi:hypothetical protein
MENNEQTGTIQILALQQDALFKLLSSKEIIEQPFLIVRLLLVSFILA